MIYFMDYENVRNLTGIEKLQQTDKFVIFYTKNANNLTFEDCLSIRETKAEVQLKMVAAGNNALDFQLSTYLGYLIGKGEKNFCIISKDKGYDSIIQFWANENNIKIEKRATFLTATPNPVKTEKKQKENNQNVGQGEESLRKALQESDLNLTEGDIKRVESIVNQYKTKVAINSNLQKYFSDNESAKQNIYKIIKPFLKEKK